MILRPRYSFVLAMLSALSPLLAPSLAAQPHHVTPAAPGAPGARPALYTNLGAHHYTITVRVPLAQQYFDQGLRLLWGFNHHEAIRAFEAAEQIDPSCAMCAWGTAYALGPNINAAMDSASGVQAFRAITRARRAAAGVSAGERALIEALAVRYAAVPKADRAALDSAWAQRIGALAARTPRDDEMQVLHADALMNLAPWNYWEQNGQPRAGTALLLSRLEGVLARNPKHPGGCHLYIHAVEAMHPERALACAERLAALMPGAGHIVHMPGHVYIRTGRWADAIRINAHAAHVDGELFEGPGVARRGIYANGYYPHNYHFLAFAATMVGRSATAITAARETAARLSADAVRTVPWVESVTPIVPLTLVTFGKWRAVLAEPVPGDSLPFMRAMTWYARGVAHAALGDATAARGDLAKLRAGAAVFPKNDNGVALQIAVAALQGEIARRGGQPVQAVTFFRAAVALEDALVYNEPPTWYYPMRHSLGAALLSAGQAAEAEKVYRADLVKFPANGWSLFGLAASLDAQGKMPAARAVRGQLSTVWKEAYVTLTASRF
jgi:tetratricopeptide (TPR) repeat protein